MTSRLRAFWKLLLQIVHWHVFVCASDPLLSPWNGFQHQNGLCETKHSPAWAMANMVPMWPQDSCFSLVVAGVGGLPFRWHDACLPQWSLQTRNWTFGTRKPDIFTQELSLSPPSFLKLLTTFDYFWPCPLPVQTTGLGNFIFILDLKPQNGKHFINLYKIESIGLKIIG